MINELFSINTKIYILLMNNPNIEWNTWQRCIFCQFASLNDADWVRSNAILGNENGWRNMHTHMTSNFPVVRSAMKCCQVPITTRKEILSKKFNTASQKVPKYLRPGIKNFS